VRLTPNKWPISNRNTGALHLCWSRTVVEFSEEMRNF
jgi:hypothetical protein